MTKYYYVHSKYSAYTNMKDRPQCSAIDVHPFEWAARLNRESEHYVTYVISWQEITEEEYKLYKSLHDEGILE